MGKVRVEKADRTVEYYKVKPVNPNIKGYARIEVLDENGGVVERQECENLVKSSHIINSESFFQELARSFAGHRAYVKWNAEASFKGASDISYMYLLDSNGVTGLEYDGLDLRIDGGTGGVLTQAYAKVGTVQSTNSKRGTWVSTDVTYPARNKRNTVIVCDFPLLTGNENSGNVDTIMLVAGNNIERDYLARRDITCTQVFSNSTGVGLRNGAETITIDTDEHHSTARKYDGEIFFCKDNADPAKTDVWVEDRIGQQHLLFETAIPTSSTSTVLDHKKDGTVGIIYRTSGDGYFGYKLFQPDGTLIKEHETTTSYGVPVAMHLTEDDKFYIVSRHDSGGGTYFHLQIFDTATNTMTKNYDTGVVNSYTGYHHYGSPMIRAKNGENKFICTDLGNDYTSILGNVYTQGYVFDFDNDFCIETHKFSYPSASPTYFHSDTNYYNRGENNNNYGMPQTATDKATGLPYTMAYLDMTIYFNALTGFGKTNKQFAINTISPINKTDQRTIRITYTIEEDFSGLALKDEITAWDWDCNIKV